jgi:hypothetical protein
MKKTCPSPCYFARFIVQIYVVSICDMNILPLIFLEYAFGRETMFCPTSKYWFLSFNTESGDFHTEQEVACFNYASI